MSKNPEEFKIETDEEETKEENQKELEEKQEEPEDKEGEAEKEIEESEQEKKSKIKGAQEELDKEFERTQEEEKKKKEEEEREKQLEIIKESLGETIPEKFKELAGDNSKEAWELRKELEDKDPMYVCASLAGVASKESLEYLSERKEIRKLWWGITRGLIGDDSEEARKLREWFETDEDVNRVRGGRWADIQRTLKLHKSEKLFNFRANRKREGFYVPGDLVMSTVGLDSEEAWKLREKFENVSPAEVLMSLAGNDSEKAWEIRKKYENDEKLKWAYEKSLMGAETQKSEP